MPTVEEIMAALQAIIDSADSENRELTDEEVQRYEDLEAQLTTASRTGQLRARHQAYNTAVRHTPAGTTTIERDQGELVRSFERYLRTATVDSVLAEYRAQNEGTGSAGGYLVPSEFANRITERRKAFGGFAEAAETMTTSDGRTIEWPTMDDTANSGEIVAEGAAAAGGADLVFGTKYLQAWKYEATGTGGLPLKVSIELAQDNAFDLQGRLSGWMGKRIARKMSVDFLTGDGTGEPLGLLTGKAAYDEITSNSAGPSYAELLATVHAVDPDYRDGASWVMNDATLAVLRGLLDGNDRPLWMPSDTGSLATGLPGGTLLGYPVVIDQAMPSIGDQTKFLAFGNMKEAYIVRHVKDVTMMVLTELYAVNGQIGYMAYSRADGTVNDSNAYVILAGQNV